MATRSVVATPYHACQSFAGNTSVLKAIHLPWRMESFCWTLIRRFG